MSIPTVALMIYPNINPFHFSIPNMIFKLNIAGKKLFNVKIFSMDGQSVTTDSSMNIVPQGGIELMTDADLVIIPGWDNLNQAPAPLLIDMLKQCYENGTKLVALCYGTYALAYTGLLKHKRAATHWEAEQDFSHRFPDVILDRDALYVEDQGIITSAGTGAALDCCLYLVRSFYGVKTANAVSRLMVIPPHREGGQAQFIEQPVAASTADAQMNALLDQVRKNLTIAYTIEKLAAQTQMNRRTFTRHFKKATGLSFIPWLNNERIKFSCELLETTQMSIEQIAEYSGFNNTVSFRKIFREKYAVSPSQWRKSFGGKS
jgi:transcriptional regulator GlxA family with amidase domain